MKFTVNGDSVTIEPLPGEMLADLLRERLGLTGTKIGCNEAECGACTVIVDGEPILSCTYPAQRVAGRKVLTIEGLAGNGHLHPLQEAFITYGAVQCGFCIPGQIMTAHALLEQNPTPPSQAVRYALKDTLCRCAGYPTIERAILAASHSLATGEPVAPPDLLESKNPLQSIGTLRPRPDSVAKVTGEARFTDDLKFDGMCHARVKRAGIPHGILRQLDTEAARALPGVVAVLTASDIPGEHNHGLVVADWPCGNRCRGIQRDSRGSSGFDPSRV